jgi:hypothetical protein
MAINFLNHEKQNVNRESAMRFFRPMGFSPSKQTHTQIFNVFQSLTSVIRILLDIDLHRIISIVSLKGSKELLNLS